MLNSLLLSAAMIGAGMQPLPMMETKHDMSASVGMAYEKAGVTYDEDYGWYDLEGVTIEVIGHEFVNRKEQYVVQYEHVCVNDDEPVLIKFEWDPISGRQRGTVIK